MTKNRDIGIITIDSEESYRRYLIKEEQNQETGVVQSAKTIDRPKDDITWEVMEDLAARANRGYVKYKTTLQDNNHQNMLQHAYEEVLDLAQYLKKEITTLNTIQDLVRQYPNDMKLGVKIRQLYAQK